jgi:hypothetical protein
MWWRFWMRTSTGRLTWSFFPNTTTDDEIEELNIPYQAAQLFTGHCRLNLYLNRFTHAASMCSCGRDQESVTHFMFRCPIFNETRQIFRHKCFQVTKIWPPTLSAIGKNLSLIKALIKFIVKSKRLDHI